VNRAEKDGEQLVVEGEDDRGLVKLPYLSMMEWTEQNGERLVVEGEDDGGLEVTLPGHDGVNRAEKDEERLVVEGEDDRGLVSVPTCP
jgi:5S rRNA maturation endonuclease (ribonuclease M5)